jgi:hypothetical protein
MRWNSLGWLRPELTWGRDPRDGRVRRREVFGWLFGSFIGAVYGL